MTELYLFDQRMNEITMFLMLKIDYFHFVFNSSRLKGYNCESGHLYMDGQLRGK